MFSRTHLQSHLVLDFCFLRISWGLCFIKKKRGRSSFSLVSFGHHLYFKCSRVIKSVKKNWMSWDWCENTSEKYFDIECKIFLSGKRKANKSQYTFFPVLNQYSWVSPLSVKRTYDSFCLNTPLNAESYHITQSGNFFLNYFRTCRKPKGNQLTVDDSGFKGSSMIRHLNKQKAVFYFSSARLNQGKF